MIAETVIEVTDATFAQDVLERSATVPVVVDFWAPWCGPCRALGPLLERLAHQDGGAWVLAKLNVDENPELAQQFRVQGIPAVKGFRDGHVVGEFVGAQPERNVRAFLDGLAPSPADQLVSDGILSYEEGDPASAEAAFHEALALAPEHSGALLGLAQVLIDQDDIEEAVPLLEAIPARAAEAQVASALLAQLRFRPTDGAAHSPAIAAEHLAQNPRDWDARWTLANAAAAQGDYPTALEHFVTIVEQNRGYRDGEARPAMLSIFAILGPDNRVTLDYQKRLAMALFS